jgi:hypothetical protein
MVLSMGRRTADLKPYSRTRTLEREDVGSLVTVLVTVVT